jgi:hypothetical protein
MNVVVVGPALEQYNFNICWNARSPLPSRNANTDRIMQAVIGPFSTKTCWPIIVMLARGMQLQVVQHTVTI